MNCPYCRSPQTMVFNSRPYDGGAKVRRRRNCLACNRRFTTLEVPAERVSAWREYGTTTIVGAVRMEQDQTGDTHD